MRRIKLTNRKSRFKPLYKQFIKLRENVQTRTKLFKFKRLKWAKLVENCKYQLRHYLKYRLKNHVEYYVTEKAQKALTLKKHYRDTLYAYRRMRLLYGNIPKKSLKRYVKKSLKSPEKKYQFNLIFLTLLEQRLDSVLYRSQFSVSFRNSRQLILHGKVLVNKKITTYPAYIVKPGDIISISQRYKALISKNLGQFQSWPIPPRHLIINYKTMEIFFCEPLATRYELGFTYNLQLEKILNSFYYI